MAYAIRATGLTKRYGDVVALDGLDLEVETGTVMGLLGPNGAGKTTTVRVLTTLIKPDAGTAEVAGVDVLRQPKELRRRIGASRAPWWSCRRRSAPADPWRTRSGPRA